MKPFLVAIFSAAVWVAGELPAPAAWDNVFQPTLFHRFRRSTTSNYVAAPVVVQSVPVVPTAAVVAAQPTCSTCNSAPPTVALSPAPAQQACNTTYVQRSYYQPVTTYQTQSYYEPVTVNRTSYYYEPVTSYRYSMYVDPCTGCSQQVSQPVVSYQLRAQNCPTQSWVQRCAQVPVQSYQKVCYWQPQTTCCTTTQGQPILADGSPAVGAPAPQSPPMIQAAPAAPAFAPQTAPPPSAPPAISTAPSITQPGTANYPPSISAERTPGSGMAFPSGNQYYQPPVANPSSTSIPSMPPASYVPAPSFPARPATVVPPAPVKLDRIVVGPDHRVEGQVVRNDNAPKANAKITFVNAAQGQRTTTYANPAGRFNIDLNAGSWLVYLYGADDLPVYHSRIDVNATRPPAVNLVSNVR